MQQYILLNNGILESNSSVLPSSEGCISQYTPLGVYRLIFNYINEIIISLMVVKMIYCPYEDSAPDIRSNIPLRLQEFPRALPSGTPSGGGVYLTVHPSSFPNTDSISLRGMLRMLSEN